MRYHLRVKSTVRAVVPAIVVAVLVAVAAGDHYFRDEFYYLACSHRMAWGYVDQPPLSIAVLWLVRHLFGDSLLVLRVVSALALAGALVLTGSIARRLGAGAFGELLAMTTLAIAPEALAVGSFYSMNVFELLLWTATLRVFIDVLASPHRATWLLLGVLLGLGLLNKISVLWLGAGIAAALVLTPARRQWLTPGPYLAGAIAAAMFLPHVLWQLANGWPTLEFIHNASTQKMVAKSPLSFLLEQVVNLHPLTMLVWGVGLIALLVDRRLRPYRGLAIVYLTVAAILIVNSTSRAVYLLPAYPPLIAAGAALWERLLTGGAARVGAIAALLLAGASSLPLAVPVLSTDAYVRYTRAVGMAPSAEEKQALGRLPQFFADRQGWEALVAQVATAWDRLSPDERASAAVFTGNYGEAGAIELYGRPRGMVAISGHNNYWLWGPQGRSGSVLIVLTRNPQRLEQQFESVQQVAETDCGDCMPYENHVGIYICRRLRTPLPQLWAALKHYE